MTRIREWGHEVGSPAGWVTQLPTIEGFFAQLASSTNESLVLKFLATFARFEYALKRSGNTVPNIRDCKPDWDKFVKAKDDAFQAICLDGLDAAKGYFEGFPPKALVLHDGRPTWEARRLSEPLGSMGYHSKIVRLVRNNLFHGEKTSVFLHQDGRLGGPTVIGEPSRNESLLQSGLVILEAFLMCDSTVSSRFSTYMPDDV